MADMGFASVGMAIGLPFCGRPVAPQWAIAYATQKYPLNTSLLHIATYGEEVGEARNKIVKHALEKRATYLWFIDDDVIVPPFAAERLGYALDQARLRDPDVLGIGGIYCAKSDPATPLVFRGEGVGTFWDWKVGDVFPVTGIGTGCLLLRTEVFARIPEPWFKTVDEYVAAPEAPTGVGCVTMTDDLYFCRKAAENGVKLLAHGGVLCGHYNYKTDRMHTLPEDSYPVTAAREREEARKASSQLPVPHSSQLSEAAIAA